MNFERSQSEKQRTNHAKHNALRPRRATSEKPYTMLKQSKKAILDEYNPSITLRLRHKHKMPALSLMAIESGKKVSNPLIPKKHLTFGSEMKDSDPQDIKKLLVCTKLIEFSSHNPCTEFLISSWLNTGWYSPTKRESIYRSKLDSHIICASLPQCLNYTFQEYMEYEWAKHVYTALTMQLTLAQKALLFYMGSNRRNRKKTLVSSVKDCIIGTEGVQWMMQHLMMKTRQDAVALGQTMMDAAYITAVVANTNTFEDNDRLYQYDADVIHRDIFTSTPSPKIPSPTINNHKNATPQTPQTPVTPQSRYVHISTPLVLKSPRIARFYRHNAYMQCLVQMTKILCPDTMNGRFSNDIKCAFYVPCTTNNNRYICKNIDYVAFDSWNEAIAFILTEFWQETFAQNVYNKLIEPLSVSQKCKLMSIALETKTRKWRLKKFKQCFIGAQGIKWLILSGFATDAQSALHLANRFWNKRLIKHAIDATKPYKNDENAFYIFDSTEIDNQSNDLLCCKPMVSKFNQHEKWIQDLISMSMTPMAEIELLLDLSKAFYLPRSQDKYSKFVSKYDANIAFENVIEALHFMLMQNWEKDYSQIVYRKLLKKLSVSQQAKLIAIGMERKTKKKHFKKYKHCIVGNEACLWMVDKGFCVDIMEAIELGNTFLNKGFIKQVNNEFEFKNNATFYRFDDIEINKQCIMESYKKRQSAVDTPYVDISPCTDKVSVSESNGNSFPDIDYDVHNANKMLSFEYGLSNDEKEKEGYKKQNETTYCTVKDEPSFPDIATFQIQRTPPIKISKSKSKSSHSSHRHGNLVYGAERIQRHHEMNNLSVYSNMAVHSRNQSHTTLGDLIIMDTSKDVDMPKPICSIMASVTDHTPEPRVLLDLGIDSEYFESTTPVATPSDSKTMATRITVPQFEEFEQDTDDIICTEDKEESPIFPMNLMIDVNKQTIESKKSTSSQSLSRYKRDDTVLHFGHHVISSFTSTDIPMDPNIFGDDANEDTYCAHFTQISNSNSCNPFGVSYNTYIPNQIGI